MANENMSPFSREFAGSFTAAPLEIAHILFLDMVAFSKLKPQQQAAVQNWLTDAVPKLPEVINAKTSGRVIFRSTGDGMFIAFFRDLLSPVRAAIQLDKSLKTEGRALGKEIGAEIHFRMGINTGPVYVVQNVNREDDLAGDGVVIAARVMECGGADHILISADVARALPRLDAWKPMVHEAGRANIKEVAYEVFSLQGQFPGDLPFGNQLTPSKVTDTRVEIRRHEVETTDKLNILDREDRIRSFVRVGGMIVGAMVAVGIISFVTYQLDPKGEKFNAIANGVKQSIVPKVTVPAESKAPVDEVYPSPSPASTPAPAVTRETAPKRDDFVPDVTVGHLEEAKETARDYGFAIAATVEEEYSDTYPVPGKVIRQSPLAGMPRQGRIIRVVVSRGAPPLKPDEEASGEVTPPEAPGPKIPQTIDPVVAPDFTGILVDAHGQVKRREEIDGVCGNGGEELVSLPADAESVGFYPSREAAKSQRCGSHPLILTNVQFKDHRLTLSEEDSRRWNEAGPDIKSKIAIVCGE